MSKAAETARQWLNDLVKNANLSEDDKKVLETKLAAPEALDYIGRSALRQADYDRLMNQSKTQLSTKMQEIQGYEQSLATWRGQTEAQVAQVQAELNKARAEAARIRQVAYSYNLTDEDLGAAVAPNTTPVGVDPNQPGMTDHPPKSFSIEDVLKDTQFQELTTMHTLLPAELNDIVAEHVDLFGKQPKGMRQIVERAMAERRPVREIWEAEFDVADKRKELETQAFESEVARRVEEERVKLRTELLTGSPSSRPAGLGSYVLSNRKELTPQDIQQNTPAQQSIDSVSAAVSHWETLRRQE
jgi:hypothetical protein